MINPKKEEEKWQLNNKQKRICCLFMVLVLLSALVKGLSVSVFSGFFLDIEIQVLYNCQAGIKRGVQTFFVGDGSKLILVRGSFFLSFFLQFGFCHKLSFWVFTFSFFEFGKIWVFELSHFGVLSFITIWVFELYQFKFLSFVKKLVFKFCHNFSLSLHFSYIWVCKQCHFWWS